MKNELHLKFDTVHLLSLHSIFIDKYLQFLHLINEAKNINE
jgi:hypothetical protein